MVANSPPFAQGLPVYTIGRRSNGWWAILLLVLIETMVFASLIVSYLYLYSSAPAWPPAGIDQPDLLLPIIETVILLATAPLVWLSDKAISRNDNRLHMLFVGVGVILLLVFLALRYVEFDRYDFRWDTDAYSSIFWMIAAFHTVHVITVVLKTLVILLLSWRGFFTAERRSAIGGNTLYWLFVVFAWLPLFATLYLFPRLI